MRYIVGIDEVGRGPLAGPVAVGAVLVPQGFSKNFFKGIKDSKKLTPEERELWLALALEAKKNGLLDFAVSFVSERVIDKKGIVYAVHLGVKRCLEKLAIEEDSQVFLDGSLRAPDRYTHQLTVVKGDEKIPVISLASIVAKVTRDRRMVRLSKKFPEFKFHLHKGYGTLMHRLALKEYGPTEVHRHTFLTKLHKV